MHVPIYVKMRYVEMELYDHEKHVTMGIQAIQIPASIPVSLHLVEMDLCDHEKHVMMGIQTIQMHVPIRVW